MPAFLVIATTLEKVLPAAGDGPIVLSALCVAAAFPLAS